MKQILLILLTITPIHHTMERYNHHSLITTSLMMLNIFFPWQSHGQINEITGFKICGQKNTKHTELYDLNNETIIISDFNQSIGLPYQEDNCETFPNGTIQYLTKKNLRYFYDGFYYYDNVINSCVYKNSYNVEDVSWSNLNCPKNPCLKLNNVSHVFIELNDYSYFFCDLSLFLKIGFLSLMSFYVFVF